MTSPEQKQADCEYLREALAAGSQRYDQMTGGIYEIYRRWNFDPKTESPESVLDQLEGGRCFFCSQKECGNQCVAEFVG